VRQGHREVCQVRPCASAFVHRKVVLESRDVPPWVTMFARGVHCMGEPVSPQPRRVARPRWLDLRLVVGVALVLGSIVLGAKVVAGADHTFAEVAASRDLAPGTVLTAADLHLTQVQLGDGTRGHYLDDPKAAVGKRLDRPVSRGELVPAASVRRVRAMTTLTVPLESGAAPDLRAGQRVEVWLSTPTCRSLVLLADVAVQSVHRDDTGSFSTGSDGQDVVIAVDPQLANRVISALAIEDAKLRAGILGGTEPAASVALPDLSGCTSNAAPR